MEDNRLSNTIVITAKKGAGSATVENDERNVNSKDELRRTERHDLRAMRFGFSV
ncbi:hypothetical protein L195_g032454 [Trifolium pratense]|uniref:Uncharacterized protein n=1 Tax=Trifolium pratense TaxID=57577 RepID=A0A2K3LD84_TRIPR|nr:hypothetical protein L195_g056823 [Trifolium pratense]PNX76505.1 hypothetical protein L195_g032454 [Trifolium pratense]